MADAAAVKREARRRRILENSENRLKRITGLYGNAGNTDTINNLVEESSESHNEPSSNTSVSVAKQTVSKPEVNYYIEAQMAYPTEEEVPVTDECLRKPTSSENKNPFLSTSSSPASQTLVTALPSLWWKTRLHIIILAVIVRILLTLPCAVLFGESAIVPLCTVEFAEWINTKLRNAEDQNAPSGLLGMALMLSGVAPQKVSHFLGVLETLNRITQDFCIYFFVFSLTHTFLEIFL